MPTGAVIEKRFKHLAHGGMGTEGDEFGLGNLPAEEDSDYEAEMELHKGHADQINRLMFTGSEDTLPEEQRGVRDASWVGKLANGAMFRLAEHQVASSFTERYITKIKANPLRFFPIPIGRRTNSLPPLPSFFPSIPPSCLLSQPGMASCCVGFGLSAAMNALGDSDWQSIQQMAKRAVQATEDIDDRVGTELAYFKRHFNDKKQHLYHVYSFNSEFNPDQMLPHDLAVCQVRLMASACPLLASCPWQSLLSRPMGEVPDAKDYMIM